MKKLHFLLITAFMIFQNSAIAYVYLEDDFNDGVIDPAWTISGSLNFGGATYSETNGYLTITDIEDSNPSVNTGARIDFYRPLECALTGDFHLDYTFSWNEYSDPDARMVLRLQLFSSTGDTVVNVQHTDPWNNIKGRKDAFIANSSYHYYSAQDLSYASTADIDVDRVEGQIAILWNGEILLTGEDFSDIVAIQLDARHNEMYDGTFGDYSIDWISLSGASPIPEPSTIILIGSGIIAFFRKKNM